jgi:hypothetical protein
MYFGDDGLVHLYFGGPPPTPPFGRWSSLDPTLPQAMVAQFDARSNRLVLSVPWVLTEIEEQPNGAVQFNALQSGAIMNGSTIAVSDGSLSSNGPAAADLCNISLTYPGISGLPSETWPCRPAILGRLHGCAERKRIQRFCRPGGTFGREGVFRLFVHKTALASPPFVAQRIECGSGTDSYIRFDPTGYSAFFGYRHREREQSGLRTRI